MLEYSTTAITETPCTSFSSALILPSIITFRLISMIESFLPDECGKKLSSVNISI